eukprot:83168-Pelagomonas_calceolata.AAC.2
MLPTTTFFFLQRKPCCKNRKAPWMEGTLDTTYRENYVEKEIPRETARPRGRDKETHVSNVFTNEHASTNTVHATAGPHALAGCRCSLWRDSQVRRLQPLLGASNVNGAAQQLRVLEMILNFDTPSYMSGFYRNLIILFLTSIPKGKHSSQNCHLQQLTMFTFENVQAHTQDSGFKGCGHIINCVPCECGSLAAFTLQPCYYG